MDLLIVDDQQIIIDGLIGGIEWEDLEIYNIYSANNITDAKAILQEKPVQIILCDIEMPGGTGLELCHWVSEQKLETEFIILSSHTEFEMAKEAVRAGGFDYIVQPATYEEIEEIVIRAEKSVKNKIEQHRFAKYGRRMYESKEQIEANMLIEILRGHVDAQKVRKTFEALGVEYRDDRSCCCGDVAVAFYRRETVFSQQTILQDTVLQYMEEALARHKIQLLSAPTASESMVYLFLSEEGQLAMGVITEVLEEMMFRMRIELGCHLVVGVSQVGCLSELGQLVDQVKRMKQRIEKPKAQLYIARGDIVTEETLGEEGYIERVTAYIKDHLSTDIRRGELAELVNLNEDYLSRIFRKRMGISLKQYILKEKMEAAKDYIDNTNLPISQISANVGFDNFSHFSQTYKKIMGHTPEEERVDG